MGVNMSNVIVVAVFLVMVTYLRLYLWRCWFSRTNLTDIGVVGAANRLRTMYCHQPVRTGILAIVVLSECAAWVVLILVVYQAKPA